MIKNIRNAVNPARACRLYAAQQQIPTITIVEPLAKAADFHYKAAPIYTQMGEIVASKDQLWIPLGLEERIRVRPIVTDNVLIGIKQIQLLVSIDCCGNK